MAVAGLAAVLAAPAVVRASDIDTLYQSLGQACWACDVFLGLADRGLETARSVSAGLAENLTTLVALVFGLWVLLWAGRTALSFGMGSGLSWNQPAATLLHFAIILAILQNAGTIWDDLFIPVLAAGLKLAVTLFSLAGAQSCPATDGAVSGALPTGLMTCPFAAIQDVFNKGMLTGLAMMIGAGWTGWSDVLRVWDWPGEILRILCGFMLALLYGFGFLIYPFLFVDAMARAVLMAITAPLAMAASLLRPTRRLAQKALWHLAQSALTLTFASVATGLATTVLASAYGGLASGEGGGLDDWGRLTRGLEDGTIKLGIADQAFWVLMTGGVMVLFMLRTAWRMASELTSAVSNDFSGAGQGGAVLAGAAAGAAAAASQQIWLGHGIAGRVAGGKKKIQRPPGAGQK